MKKVLISNPFLFPPSGVNEEEKKLFQTRADFVKDYILFSLNDFQKAWDAETESVGKNYQEDLFTPPIQSPTLSTTSAQLIPFDFAMDANENLLSDIPSFDSFELEQYQDYQFSPMYNDLEKEGLSLKEHSFADEIKQQKEVQAFCQIDSLEPSMFSVTTGEKGFSSTNEKLPATEEHMASESNPLVDGENMWLCNDSISEAGTSFNMLLEISAADPDPDSFQPLQEEVQDHMDIETVDTSQIQITYPPVKNEKNDSVTCTNITTSTITKTRRKSVQTSRNVQDSPMSFQLPGEESINLQDLESEMQIEKKPFALAPLNGTENRSRHVSASTSEAESSLSKQKQLNRNGELRKKRKYEIEDDNDPSVKNAKAAKMNRDKKKVQMQELKKQVENLKNENQKLQQINTDKEGEVQQLKGEVKHINHLLQAEKAKNSANSKQKVTMLDLIQNVTSVMQPPPTVICVTERLAATQMPNPSEIEAIRSMQHAQQPQLSNGTDTYLTFKDPIND